MKDNFLITYEELNKRTDEKQIHYIDVFVEETFKFASEKKFQKIVCLSNYIYRCLYIYAKENNINLDIINANDKNELQNFIHNYNDFGSNLYLFVSDASCDKLDINFYLDYLLNKTKDKYIDSIMFSAKYMDEEKGNQYINDYTDSYHIRQSFVEKFTLLTYCESWDRLQLVRGVYQLKSVAFYRPEYISLIATDSYKEFFYPARFDNQSINKTIDLIKEATKQNQLSLTNIWKDYKDKNKQKIRNKIYATVYSYFQKDFDYLDMKQLESNIDYNCQKKVAFMPLDKLIAEMIQNIGNNPNDDIYNQILFSLLVMESKNMIEIHNNGEIFGYSDEGIYVRIKSAASYLCITKYNNPQVMDYVLQYIYSHKSPLETEYREQFLRNVNKDFDLGLSEEQMLEIVFNSEKDKRAPEYRRIFDTYYFGIIGIERHLIEVLKNIGLIPEINSHESEMVSFKKLEISIKMIDYIKEFPKQIPDSMNPPRTELSEKVKQKLYDRKALFKRRY